MATLEQQVADLTAQTIALLNAVNVQKSYIDAASQIAVSGITGSSGSATPAVGKSPVGDATGRFAASWIDPATHIAASRVTASGLIAGGGGAFNGTSTPTDGVATEILHDGTTGIVQSYSRSGGAYKALGIYGLTVIFGSGASATEAMRVDASGNLLVGVESGTCHSFLIPGIPGTKSVDIGGNSIMMYSASAASANAALTVLAVGHIASSGRSISASGTINVSGADYAEYMRKAATCGNIAKGQIVGINASGEVTDKWSAAISFAVKTTNPSYVGGDTWGGEDVVGKRPEVPQRAADVTERRLVSGTVEAVDAVYETIVLEAGDSDAQWAAKEAQHATTLATFEAALEAARQQVDRIAFAGQVPVNVQGATPGQYIVPAQDGDGIKGILKAEQDMSLSEYMRAIGKIIAIEADGRARIIVKVA